jgi:hypothetical protein
MRMFWPKDKVDAWRAAVTSEDGTEILQALNSFEPDPTSLVGKCPLGPSAYSRRR